LETIIIRSSLLIGRPDTVARVIISNQIKPTHSLLCLAKLLLCLIDCFLLLRETTRPLSHARGQRGNLPLSTNDLYFPLNNLTPLGLVWEMEDSSGWKRIEGDFEKF
jgi:hypothetical protein